MALNFNRVDAVLTASAAIVIQAPMANQVLILKATVCNTDTIAHEINVYRVPNGGSAGAANIMIQGETIGAGETVVLPLSGQPFINADSLQAQADLTTVVNLSIGYAVTP